jgi:hypothetical protein
MTVRRLFEPMANLAVRALLIIGLVFGAGAPLAASTQLPATFPLVAPPVSIPWWPCVTSEGPCHCCEAYQTDCDRCSERNGSAKSWTKN